MKNYKEKRVFFVEMTFSKVNAYNLTIDLTNIKCYGVRPSVRLSVRFDKSSFRFGTPRVDKSSFRCGTHCSRANSNGGGQYKGRAVCRSRTGASPAGAREETVGFQRGRGGCRDFTGASHELAGAEIF